MWLFEKPFKNWILFQNLLIYITRGTFCGTLCSVGNICLWSFHHWEVVYYWAWHAWVHKDNSPAGTGPCTWVLWQPQPYPQGNTCAHEHRTYRGVVQVEIPLSFQGKCLWAARGEPVARTDLSVFRWYCNTGGSCWSELRSFEGWAHWEILINESVNFHWHLFSMELLCELQWEPLLFCLSRSGLPLSDYQVKSSICNL